MQEMWVRSLGQEEPLEEEMAPAPVFWPGGSQGLGPGGLQPVGSQRVGRD